VAQCFVYYSAGTWHSVMKVTKLFTIYIHIIFKSQNKQTIIHTNFLHSVPLKRK